MENKDNQEDILKNILRQYGSEDKTLFQLKHKFMIYIELSPDYQFLEDGSLNEKYIEDCIYKSIEVFNFVDFSDNLLIVYEDAYGDHTELEKQYLESTLIDIKKYDRSKIKWKFSDDDDIYNGNRYIYHVKGVDKEKLFRQIILSDLGGKIDFSSAISIIDINSGSIFHLYDDRGLRILSLEEEYIKRVSKHFESDVF